MKSLESSQALCGRFLAIVSTFSRPTSRVISDRSRAMPPHKGDSEGVTLKKHAMTSRKKGHLTPLNLKKGQRSPSKVTFGKGYCLALVITDEISTIMKK